jgi:hypothetical protein
MINAEITAVLQLINRDCHAAKFREAGGQIDSLLFNLGI